MVELPSLGASETDLIIPVPLGATNIGGSLLLGEDTLSVLGQIVTSVAGETGSIVSVPGVTVIVDWLTLSVESEIGSFSAGETVLSIEFGTERVIDGWDVGVDDTASVLKDIASIAGLTDTTIVPGFTIFIDFGTDILGVEVISD